MILILRLCECRYQVDSQKEDLNNDQTNAEKVSELWELMIGYIREAVCECQNHYPNAHQVQA